MKKHIPTELATYLGVFFDGVVNKENWNIEVEFTEEGCRVIRVMVNTPDRFQQDWCTSIEFLENDEKIDDLIVNDEEISNFLDELYRENG